MYTISTSREKQELIFTNAEIYFIKPYVDLKWFTNYNALFGKIFYTPSNNGKVEVFCFKGSDAYKNEEYRRKELAYLLKILNEESDDKESGI